MEQQPTSNVQLQLDANNQGRFVYHEGDSTIAEMVLSVADNILTVYHTEVQPAYEGKGLARQLLDAMVTYARAQYLKVRPLCPYVLAQFRRHPDQYSDIWLKETVH